MAKYNVIPAKNVNDLKITSTEMALATIYEGVKNKVMPCMLIAAKDIPEDFLTELAAAGYRVEMTDWSRTENLWRVYWDFTDYRTVEKEQNDSYLDRF